MLYLTQDGHAIHYTTEVVDSSCNVSIYTSTTISLFTLKKITSFPVSHVRDRLILISAVIYQLLKFVRAKTHLHLHLFLAISDEVSDHVIKS